MYDEDQLETIALAESGLTLEEQNDVRAIAQLVYEEPEAVDSALRSVGIVPDVDDEQKVLQLVKASLSTVGFDANLEEQMQMRGFSFKGLGKKIGSIFKKGGGKKVAYALGGIFKGKKKKLAEALAKKQAGQPLTKRDMKALAKAGIGEPKTGVMGPPIGGPMPIMTTAAARQTLPPAVQGRYTDKEITRAQEKKKPGETLAQALKRLRQMKVIQWGASALGIILGAVLIIWAIRSWRRRMKKAA